MSRHWYFIINPVSGKGKGIHTWQRVQPLLEASGVSFNFGISEYHQHTLTLITEAYQKGCRNFIGIGGDGTINEIVNAIFNVQKFSISDPCTISLMPVGTGNDWVRTHPKTLTPENLISRVRAKQTTFHDVGLLQLKDTQNTRYFINVAGAGIDGSVAKELELLNKSGKKTKVSYVQSMLKALRQFDAPQTTVKADGRVIYEGKSLLVASAHGQFFGGGMHISPAAKADDGNLDITLVKKESNWVILPQLPRLFTGAIAKIPFVEKHTFTTVEMINSNAVPVQADGEYIGESTHINFSVIKRAILVLA